MLALLTVGALLAGKNAGLLTYWQRALVTVFGWGAVGIPAVFLVWAADAFLDHNEKRLGPSYHAVVGCGLMVLAMLGLLHMLADDPLRWAETGRGGGYIGYLLGGMLQRGLGGFGTAVVLLAMFVAGTGIFMNNELRAVIARLRPAHAPQTWEPQPPPTETLPRTTAPPEPPFMPHPVPEPRPRPQRVPQPPDFGPAPRDVLVPPPIIRKPQPTSGAIPPADAAPRDTETEAPSPPRMIRQEPPALLKPPVPSAITITQAIPKISLAPEPSAATPSRPALSLVPKMAAEPAPAQPTKSATPAPEPATPEPVRWTLPTTATMEQYPDVAISEDELEKRATVIEQTLASFRVEATVREINPGPAITQFALEPGVGVKVRRVTELQNDLALALAVPALRIEAPIPGKSRIGIEIPNESVAVVGLRDALESPDFGKARAKLPIPLGRDVNGHYQIADLAKMPHLLIAGSTGSGKSVCMNVVISSLLINRTPDELRMVLVDPKMVEMSEYNGIPHLLAPVITDMEKVIGILRWAVTEMERRYQLFMRTGVRNIEAYHKKSKEIGEYLETPMENIPYIVIIIDELADLMMTAPDDVETALVRLAQKARATGMHLVIATQRPSVDVITGLIKANFPARIAFAVTSMTDSRVILDIPGAERLLGRGDMLYKAADSDKPLRIQGAWIADRDIAGVVSHWRRLAPTPQYKPEVAEAQGDGKSVREEPGGDNLIDRARQIVREQGWASTSNLQSRLRIGYNRAARLIESLEREGILGPQDGARRRQVMDADDAPTDETIEDGEE